MQTYKLADHNGQIVIEEIRRDYSEPFEAIYRWPTNIRTIDWKQNWGAEYIGKQAWPVGYGGLYRVDGMLSKLSLANGAETHNIGFERRPIPPPKRIKEPFYHKGFWRNRRGEPIS